MRVLVIGCGSIGATIAHVLDEMEEIERVYITEKRAEWADEIKNEFKKVEFINDISLVLPDVDLVVEAASQDAVVQYAREVISAGKDLLLMSVGALVDERFRDGLEQLAKRKGVKIYIPSGAVTGIDGLAAASVKRIDEITLISTKPPSAYAGVAYLEQKGIDLDKINSKRLLFEGKASDAVRYFPKNINVAATISLTGVGFERTRVEIYADPKITTNQHQLIVRGEFGEIVCNTSNNPFPKNKRTSYLAALSAIAAVKKILSDVWTPV